MTAVVVRSDAGRLPLPDASVDLIVTSPPYFALRSYTDGGQHYAGQVGSEATPAAYIAALVACTREWLRVLKPSGSIFVNLGDKYAERGGPERAGGVDGGQVNHRAARPRRLGRPETGVRAKSLMLLPERYRIACVDELGLIARAVIVWAKPNGLPESVTDRVRRSHEDWVHLTKQPRYFTAVDEIREPHAPWTLKAYAYEQAGDYKRRKNPNRVDQGNAKDYAVANPLGKLPGSVWTIATEPLKVPDRLAVDHFAAFPTEWPRRLILGWSPSGVCTACGEGRRPVVTVGAYEPAGHGQRDASALRRRMPGEGRNPLSRHGEMDSTLRTAAARTITGYACACPDVTAPTRPSVVLDPFGGTGTTAHVATALGRTGITVDLSADYCRLAVAPELADARLRKVLGIDRAEPVLAGQLDLLSLGDPA